MNTAIFFTLSQGRWIIQRTLYNIEDKNTHHSQYEILIAPYSNFSQARTKKELHQISQARLSINNIKTNHLSLFYVEKIREKFNENNIRKVCNKMEYNYTLYSNSSSSVSLIHNIGDLTILEKVWFINSNLRLSMSLIKKKNKYLLTSFTSEIKMSS